MRVADEPASESARPSARLTHSSFSAGRLAHDKLMRRIELDGREVIPRVRALLAAKAPESADEAAASTR